jgi:nucleotide-binding universal stress UspA family protein
MVMRLPRPQTGSSRLPAPRAPGRVVVGVNGSQLSGAALEWACGEAVRRGADLEIVTAWDPYPAAEWCSEVEEWRADVRAQVEDAIQAANLITRGRVAVHGTVREGRPVQVLLEEAVGAALLVIGSTGHLGFLGAIAGSISRHCAREAQCPVVILGPSVVTSTVTGYLTSAVLDTRGAVTRWLGGELSRRPLPVFVVDSWDVAMAMPGPLHAAIPIPPDQGARAQHAGAVARMRSQLGVDVDLSVALRQGRPAEGLCLAGQPGDLVLIPRSALHDVEFSHETCPVLVIPDDDGFAE